MIFLTQQERDKFAAWLEQEAKSDDEMAGLLSKMTGHEAMIKHKKQRVAIFFFVASEIRKIEDDSIGG